MLLGADGVEFPKGYSRHFGRLAFPGGLLHKPLGHSSNKGVGPVGRESLHLFGGGRDLSAILQLEPEKTGLQ
jgi:hypothetical protein